MGKIVKLSTVSAKLQTKLVTTKVLYHLRYNRHFHLVATECGYYNSDILAIHKDRVYEVEVKVSYQDFQHEFSKSYTRYRKTIKKHEIYAHLNSTWIPNYYYFAVPEDLVEKVHAYLTKIESPYGLISVQNGRIIPKEAVPCVVVKVAKLLHKKPANESFRHCILARLSSELVLRRMDVCNMLYNQEVGK